MTFDSLRPWVSHGREDIKTKRKGGGRGGGGGRRGGGGKKDGEEDEAERKIKWKKLLYKTNKEVRK